MRNRVDAKIAARQWILNAIQNHSCIPNKQTEREIRKFITRLQKDLNQLIRSREMFILVNSQDTEEKAQALKNLSEMPKLKPKNRRQRAKSAGIARLIKEQRRDANDTRIKFKHAISEN